MTERRFYSALRAWERSLLEKTPVVDIIVGIPCYLNDATIHYVIKMVQEGLEKYFPQKKSLIYVADGGSTDDTREEARRNSELFYNSQKIVTIYRGIPGKGTALRAIFEAVSFSGAAACCVVDADLRSISPQWIQNLLSPVFRGSYDYVTPFYHRFKYDGTITNTIAYNLNRALYGKNIRQPIGGDFGLSRNFIEHLLQQDVWESDIARYGIDIWMTTEACAGPFKICQTPLGVKIHDEKDPLTQLSSMFTQVVSTIFTLMERNHEIWKSEKKCEEVEFVGEAIPGEPKPFNVNAEALWEYFRLGYRNFGSLWKSILNPESYSHIEGLALKKGTADTINNYDWVKIVYDYAVAYHATSRQRIKILQTLIPLYNLRVACFVSDLENTEDITEIDRYFDRLAETFEELRPYLIQGWDAPVPEVFNV